MDVDWKQYKPVIDLLDEFYCWKSTLGEYFEYVFRQYNIDSRTREKIFDDETNRLNWLLHRTIIACCCNIDVIPMSLDLFTTFCQQKGLVNRVIEVNCQKRANVDNVLSRGYSLCKQGSKRERLHGTFSVQCDHPNTTTSYMYKMLWDELLSRIGCDLMLYILQNMSLFHAMHRNNLLQVSGVAIDKSNVKDKGHKCMPKFLDFVNQLPPLCNAEHRRRPKTGIPADVKGSFDSPPASNLHNTDTDETKAKEIERFEAAFRENEMLDTDTLLSSPEIPFKRLSPRNNANKRPLTHVSDDITKMEKSYADNGSKLCSNNGSVSPEIPFVRAKTSSRCSAAIRNPTQPNYDENESKMLQIEDEVSLCIDVNSMSPEIPLLQHGASLSSKRRAERDRNDTGDTDVVNEPPCKKRLIMDSAGKLIRSEPAIHGTNVKDYLQRQTVMSREYCSQNSFTKGQRNACEDNSSESRNAAENYPALIFDNSNRQCKNGCANEVDRNCENSKQKQLKNFHRKRSGKKWKKESNKLFGKWKITNSNEEEKKGNGCAKDLTILDKLNRRRKGMIFDPVETKVEERKAFRMFHIMHNSQLHEGLHKSHILNNVDGTKKGARLLALDIFARDLNHSKSNEVNISTASVGQSKDSSIKKLPKNLQRSLAWIRKLIHNYKKLQLHKILQKYCPSSKAVKALSYSYRRSRRKKKVLHKPSSKCSSEKQDLLYKTAFADHIPPYKVIFFIKSVCKKVIPRSVLHTESNWSTFFKNLARFFTLGKHEFITLPLVTNGIKVSDCHWTFKLGKRPNHVPRSFSTWQQKTVDSCICWIVAKFILPLVKACFYVTENGFHGNRVFYYRRKTWAAIECVAKEACLKKNFVECDEKAVNKAISIDRTFGCGKIRFIPKANKLRPIIKPSRSNSQLVSKNFKIERLLHVLKHVTVEKPELIGSAVSDMDEISERLKTFRNRMINKEQDDSPVYFVASDIVSCFDSIPHDRLINVVDKALQRNDYVIRKFSATSYITFKKCLTVTKRVATNKADLEFPAFLANYLKLKKCPISNAIISDGVFNTEERNDSLYHTLQKLIAGSYVKFGSKYYRLTRGIAQGSTLSTFFCNILYGDMEQRHLKEFMTSEDCVLMRWTDDFLLITSSQDRAVKFLETLVSGFPEYGCQINMTKSKTNLPESTSDQLNKIKRMNGDWFPWCNLLINVKSLEVRFSYQRYIGKSVRNSFSVRFDSRPGRRLLSRMMQHVRIQAAAIILDPKLNSLENILTNVYQIFCFVIIKLNHQIRHLPKHGQPNSNPKFFFLVIHCIFKAFYKQYRRVNEKICVERARLVPKETMKYLYYTAIFSVLHRRKTRYMKLLKFLKANFGHEKPRGVNIEKIKTESEVFNKIC